MSLAHYALVHTRSWGVNGRNHRARLAAKCDQLDHEVRLLRDEIRIKDARLARIPAVRRPHYPPHASVRVEGERHGHGRHELHRVEAG